jgi:hypothetical protein
MANVQDGVFDFVNGVLREIKASGLSRQSVMQLAALAPTEKDALFDQDAVIAAAEAIDPKIAAIFRTLKGQGKLAAVLILLATLLATCKFNINASVDINRLVDQFGGSGTAITSPVNPGGGRQDANRDKKRAKPDPASSGTGKEDANVAHGLPPKEKSRRRAEVSRQRRNDLRKRREAFNPRNR